MTIERYVEMQAELSLRFAHLNNIHDVSIGTGKRNPVLDRDIIIADLLDECLFEFTLNSSTTAIEGEFTNILSSEEYTEVLSAINKVYGSSMNYDFVQPIAYQFDE